MRKRKVYAMGTVRGRSTHFLKARESNFRRARKTVLETLRNNTRWTVAVICEVIFNEDGTEKDLKEIWRSRPTRRISRKVLEERY